MIKIDGSYLVVGERRWWGTYHCESIHTPDLDWETRQFMVRFESKWSVSIIWGYATYSDNHDLPWYPNAPPFNETPTLVEAAILHHDRERLQNGGDPYEYINAEQLNEVLDFVSKLPTETLLADGDDEPYRWPTFDTHPAEERDVR